MLRLLGRKGQSTAEYAILIGIVIAAVIGMQSFVSSKIRAKIYDAATSPENIPGIEDYPAELFTKDFYEPNTESYTRTQRSGIVRWTRLNRGGEIIKNFIGELTNRTGNFEAGTPSN